MSTLVSFILAMVMEFITPNHTEIQVSILEKEACTEISHSNIAEEKITTLIIC